GGGWSPEAPPRTPAAPAGVPIAATHPRILLPPERAAALERAASANATGWRATKRRCDELLTKPTGGGYEGWNWANALASLVTCWTGTHEARYRTAAARYLEALTDDRRELGDHKGGDPVVEHDDGYPIRTFAVFAALGYDWLHDAPEMTSALRDRITHRLVAWVAWYKDKGYLRDQPFSNHFIGYFTAEAMAGIALEGDDPRGDEMHRHARDVL